MKVSIVSFSYPRGVPDDPDDDYWGGFVFDCRLLHDPHDDMSLRGYSGLDKPVFDFFERHKALVDGTSSLPDHGLLSLLGDRGAWSFGVFFEVFLPNSEPPSSESKEGVLQLPPPTGSGTTR